MNYEYLILIDAHGLYAYIFYTAIAMSHAPAYLHSVLIHEHLYPLKVQIGVRVK